MWLLSSSLALPGMTPLASLSGQEMDGLCTIWSNLTNLEIRLDEDGPISSETNNVRLHRVSMSATRLQTLMLTGGDVLIGPQLCTVHKGVLVSPLRKLLIQEIDTSEIYLLQFVSRYHATLKELTLSGITLFSKAQHGWSDVMEQLEGMLELTSFYADFLSQFDDEESFMFGTKHGSVMFGYNGTEEEVSAQLKELAMLGRELRDKKIDSPETDDDYSLEVYEDEEYSGWSDNEGCSDLNGEEETSDGSDNGHE
ncbi:hypothetical protein CBER1_11557 [Cercospora berteroae]|uniref:Uncharacterized protein n=1 Tax=Cercospora berteroae TaxID=357750 RepID=A0A2S6C096_9PEZI|nr:hypothetical protein CBER1_11557 [Cercospora berteroae]